MNFYILIFMMIWILMLVLLSILEKFFLQDGAVSGRNEKDSRIFHSNLLETQIHQQYSNGDVNNHIAEHHWQTKHEIDWDIRKLVYY